MRAQLCGILGLRLGILPQCARHYDVFSIVYVEAFTCNA